MYRISPYRTCDARWRSPLTITASERAIIVTTRADSVVVFPFGRWCPPQETSQPHLHPPPPPPPPTVEIRRSYSCLIPTMGFPILVGHLYTESGPRIQAQCLNSSQKSCRVLMASISNNKHKIEEKSTRSSRSSSKVVGLWLADLWAFPALHLREVLVGLVADTWPVWSAWH